MWDSSLKDEFKSICVEHDEIMKSDNGLIKWLELLHHTGIAIVKNAPIEEKSGFTVLNRISPVSYTHLTLPTTPYV